MCYVSAVASILPPRNPLTKDELINGLNIALNSFLYGCICAKLVQPKQWEDVARRTAVFGDVEIQLGPLVRRAFNADFVRNEGFQRNYENSLLRSMMREAHELILLYCEETDQFVTYKAESWFQFARVMRNIISHKEGGTLRRWPDDLRKKNITSVSWRTKTLDATMLGHQVVFYPPDGLELMKDQIDFATQRLK